MVLGAYFIGYFITQIPGGRIAELFGGKWVFLVAVLLNILGSLLSPVCSYAGYEWLVVMRIIQGLGGGVTFPAMNVLISKWAPCSERSTISSIVFGGKMYRLVYSRIHNSFGEYLRYCSWNPDLIAYCWTNCWKSWMGMGLLLAWWAFSHLVHPLGSLCQRCP